MPKNSAATARASAEARARSGAAPQPTDVDSGKIDAHRITFEEYLEIPELDDTWLEPINVEAEGRVVRRGQPRKPDAKAHVSLRLSPDVLEHFRARGPGWQAHIDSVLRAAMSVERDAAERGVAGAAGQDADEAGAQET